MSEPPPVPGCNYCHPEDSDFTHGTWGTIRPKRSRCFLFPRQGLPVATGTDLEPIILTPRPLVLKTQPCASRTGPQQDFNPVCVLLPNVHLGDDYQGAFLIAELQNPQLPLKYAVCSPSPVGLDKHQLSQVPGYRDIQLSTHEENLPPHRTELLCHLKLFRGCFLHP